MMTPSVLLCLALMSVSALGEGIYGKDVVYSENAIDFPYYPQTGFIQHRQDGIVQIGGVVTTPIGRLMLLKTALTWTGLGLVAYRASRNQQLVSNVCNKVNEILGITSLGDTTDDAINPSTGNYVLASNAIADDTNACTPPTGITLTNTAGVALANTAAATALSLENFNTFRKQVATAISTLDKKIDEILDKATLTCSS